MAGYWRKSRHDAYEEGDGPEGVHLLWGGLDSAIPAELLGQSLNLLVQLHVPGLGLLRMIRVVLLYVLAEGGQVGLSRRGSAQEHEVLVLLSLGLPLALDQLCLGGYEVDCFLNGGLFLLEDATDSNLINEILRIISEKEN